MLLMANKPPDVDAGRCGGVITRSGEGTGSVARCHEMLATDERYKE